MMGRFLISQGEIVQPALPSGIFSWYRLISARALNTVEQTKSPFCPGSYQHAQLIGVWLPRGLPPSTLGAIKGLGLASKPSLPPSGGFP